VIHTLTIPRGEIVMAAGTATADATDFELKATQSLDTWGICSTPFLDRAFKTTEFRIRVTLHDDGTNRSSKVGYPMPNPLAWAAEG